MSDSSQSTTLPARFEDADVDHLVVLIDMLQRLIVHNDKIPLSPESLTRFHSRSAPGISVLEYLRRIAKYTNVERTCLIITLHYIDQICARVAGFTVSSLTVHRFLIASIAVSSKALCDVFCTNSFYAKVGGVRVMELNVLEKELLAAIDWRLTCTRELLQEYYVNLVRTHSAGRYRIAEPATPDAGVSRSRSATPVNAPKPVEPTVPTVPMQDALVPAEPAGVLMGKTVSAPSSPAAQTGPTALEQNMAFAALVVMSPCVGPMLRPEKRPSGHVADDGDSVRPVKRKLGA